MKTFAERARRLWCRLFGHRIVRNTLGHPVVGDFQICLRCGKWER